jgi:endo-1,4-beta-xylanase
MVDTRAGTSSTDEPMSTGVSRRAMLVGTAAGVAGTALGAAPIAGAEAATHSTPYPLWRTAGRRGILYGSSIATWQLDEDYSALYKRQAAVLWPEDDLLWYRLKPTPESPLDFSYADQIIELAEANKQLVFGGPGLVWDEGFGDGWQDSDLWDISEERARKLLYGTLRAVVHRYRGRVAAWIVVNEAIVNGTDEGHRGLREDVPWFATIGPEYVREAFHLAHETDPHACLVLNDFGYETVNQYGDEPADKMRATLKVLDDLHHHHVPVHAFGVQAHLLADQFRERFHAKQYRRFLRELADRGLKIFITEMDVLDDGLPAATGPRDRAVADVYRRYLDVALEERDVAAVISFGLTDRYTWLDEDYPRDDGAHRRPLAFDDALRPKPAFHAIQRALHDAPRRRPRFVAPRGRC